MRVGVSVIDETELATDAVYEVVALANVGDSVPLEIDIADRVASVDAGAAYVKPPPYVEVVPDVLTTTSLAPDAGPGVVAVIVVEFTSVTPVAATPPIVTLVAPEKFVPVIVMLVPPDRAPLDGLIELIVGAPAT